MLRLAESVVNPAPSNWMDILIEEWSGNLRGRGKKPRTILSFTTSVKAAARECRWTCMDEITTTTVLTYLDQSREARKWKAGTYNRSLCALRSFTRFLRKTGRSRDDGLALADRARDDGDEGSRAATLDEARAIIKEAWTREQYDGRCRGARALYWTCLFAAGLRVGEPEKWTWGHVHLDEEVPHIAWQREWQKNGKRALIALPPELAVLLKIHRGKVPSGPDAPVFPKVPPRNTFRVDRDRAGITVLDKYRRRFSPHSARKYFSTISPVMGIPEKFADFFMRHSGRPEHRYFQPDLQAQKGEIAKVPLLWPERIWSEGENALDFSSDPCDIGGVKLGTPNNSTIQPGGVGSPRASHPDAVGAVRLNGQGVGDGPCIPNRDEQEANRAAVHGSTGNVVRRPLCDDGSGDAPVSGLAVCRVGISDAGQGSGVHSGTRGPRGGGSTHLISPANAEGRVESTGLDRDSTSPRESGASTWRVAGPGLSPVSDQSIGAASGDSPEDAQANPDRNRGCAVSTTGGTQPARPDLSTDNTNGTGDARTRGAGMPHQLHQRGSGNDEEEAGLREGRGVSGALNQPGYNGGQGQRPTGQDDSLIAARVLARHPNAVEVIAALLRDPRTLILIGSLSALAATVALSAHIERSTQFTTGIHAVP